MRRLLQAHRMNGRFEGIGHHEDDLKIRLQKDVQKAAGQCDPSMTKHYDRRGHNPKKESGEIRCDSIRHGGSRS
jgi:hypothetical protein